MFGSVFKMQAKPGKKQELLALFQDTGERPAPGFVAAYAFDMGGDELWGVAVFEDEATYRKNAASPEQDAEYRQMRELLAVDPEWHDGVIASVMGAGR